MASHCGGIRRLRVTLLVLGAVLLTHRPFVQGEDFHGDPKAVLVERDGRIVDRLPAERIALAYPELRGRAEVNAALDSAGTIWAAIGYSVGTLVTLTGSTRLDKSFRPIGGWQVQAIRWKLPPREEAKPR